jgi:hypothetical protein
MCDHGRLVLMCGYCQQMTVERFLVCEVRVFFRFVLCGFQHKSKTVPLHAIVALGVRGCIAPTHDKAWLRVTMRDNLKTATKYDLALRTLTNNNKEWRTLKPSVWITICACAMASFLTPVILVDVSSHMVTVSHGWARIVTLRHHSLLFLKLVRCQVVYGYSFHVVTHCNALSRVVTLCPALSWILSLGLFSRASVLFMFHHTFTLFLTLGHALSRFVMNGHSWSFSSRLSHLFMFHGTWLQTDIAS